MPEPFVKYVDLAAQWKEIRERALLEIDSVLSTGRYLDHDVIDLVEKSLAKLLNVKYVTSLNSGTDALLMALKVIGIGQGDEVITVPNSFIASVAAIEHVGARATFVDVGLDHLMNTSLIEERITRQTRAIMPVHLEGKMVDMVSIRAIASKYGLFVIEDAAQSIGSTFAGVAPGSFSDIACFSMHPLKNLNAVGDAGFIATNNSNYAERIARLRNHGQHIRNESDEFGFVSRLDSIQAAVLNIRIQDLEKNIVRRRHFAEIYSSELLNSDIDLPIVKSEVFHTFHLYVIELDNRDEVQNKLLSKGIETKVHYPKLITQQRAFLARYPHFIQEFPIASQQVKRILSLPIHQHLSEEKIRFVVNTLREIA